MKRAVNYCAARTLGFRLQRDRIRETARMRSETNRRKCIERIVNRRSTRSLRPGRVLRGALSVVPIFRFVVDNINEIRLIARHTFPRIIRCPLACYPRSPFAVSYSIFFLRPNSHFRQLHSPSALQVSRPLVSRPSCSRHINGHCPFVRGRSRT